MIQESILLFILTIVIIIRIIISVEFYSIAKLKGYTGGKYFFYPFLLGLSGYLIVIALPEKNVINQGDNSTCNSSSSAYKKELLAKRDAAAAILKGRNQLSDSQRKSLQNLIQSIDKKLENL